MLVMTKRNEEWGTREICIVLAYCTFFYAVGVLLLYFKELLGFGFIFIPTLFFIPALIEARKKIRGYLKKRRIENLKKSQETVVIGGIPQKHHKKKKQPDVFDYPTINDETSKGKLMEELGLWYDKPAKRSSFEEKEEDAVTPQKHERTNKLDAIFDYLEMFGKIRFSYQSHVGNLRGADISKSVLREAKRRGLSNVTVKQKGKDVIISMAKRSGKRVIY